MIVVVVVVSAGLPMHEQAVVRLWPCIDSKAETALSRSHPASLAGKAWKGT